ncbi:hypothetical protein PUN28_005937 [Cardiocondyla obscurior]|uniref:Uncharacterized protein n=1 Tax=Cardiocondyla obscurior TaxID=286306 RepID=A0AAW2G8D0_9HYME
MAMADGNLRDAGSDIIFQQFYLASTSQRASDRPTDRPSRPRHSATLFHRSTVGAAEAFGHPRESKTRGTSGEIKLPSR